MRLIDADTLCEGRVENDPVVIHAKCAPTVDPVKHGKWISFGHDWKCSVCGYGVMPWNNTPYCPNCGSKMDLE